MLPISETKQIQVVEELPPPDPFDPQPPNTCEIGFHKDFSGKCVPDDPIGELPRDKLIDTLKGFLFGKIQLLLIVWNSGIVFRLVMYMVSSRCSIVLVLHCSICKKIEHY